MLKHSNSQLMQRNTQTLLKCIKQITCQWKTIVQTCATSFGNWRNPLKKRINATIKLAACEAGHSSSVVNCHSYIELTWRAKVLFWTASSRVWNCCYVHKQSSWCSNMAVCWLSMWRNTAVVNLRTADAAGRSKTNQAEGCDVFTEKFKQMTWLFKRFPHTSPRISGGYVQSGFYVHTYCKL